MQFDLVGIGNPVYDVIVTPAARTHGRVLSGCSTNGCLAAKKLGMGKVGLVGRIGPDFMSRFRLDMERYGVETRIDTSGRETGGFSLIYDEAGNRTLDVLGVAGKIRVKNFPENFLDTRFFLLGPILGEIDYELVEYIRSSSSAKIFLDPQGLVRTVGRDGRVLHRCDREAFGKIARLTDFIKPNEHESETITGQRDPRVALRQLREFGPAIPIVTLAEQGSLLLDNEKVYQIPAFPTQAVDPTGAGDVYAGSFMTEYARTSSFLDAAIFASAAASIMVEQIGPDFSMPIEEVRRRTEAIRGRLDTWL